MQKQVSSIVEYLSNTVTQLYTYFGYDNDVHSLIMSLSLQLKNAHQELNKRIYEHDKPKNLKKDLTIKVPMLYCLATYM